MRKYTEIFEYMRKCPQLANLWSVAATEDVGVKVILPVGTSAAMRYEEQMDVVGDYEANIVPYPSVYEDYQINCYKVYDPADNSAPDNNINVMSLDAVQEICDWIAEQDAIGNLPNITGEQVISIECNPFNPQIRGIDRQENRIAYFITIRIRYVNRKKGRSVYYECSD